MNIQWQQPVGKDGEKAGIRAKILLHRFITNVVRGSVQNTLQNTLRSPV